jgi:WD40 repeat protein
MSFLNSIIRSLLRRSKDTKKISKLEIRAQAVMNNSLLPKVLVDLIVSYDHCYFAGKLMKTFGKHVGIILIAVHPTGRIFSGSYDGTIKVWNDKTFECEIIYNKHCYEITCIGFIPNECMMVSGAFSKVLKVWEFKTCLDEQSKVASMDKKIGVTEPLIINECKFELIGHNDIILCLTVLNNGLIVSGSRDKTLRVWNAHNRICEKILVGHNDCINSVTILPNNTNELIVSASYDMKIKIWNPNNGNCLRSINTNYMFSHVTALSNDVIMYNLAHTLISWNIKNNKLNYVHNPGHICHDIVIPKTIDKKIVSVWSQGMLLLSNSKNSDNVYAFANLNKPINITAHPCGYIVSGAFDGTIQIWK